MSNPKLGAQIQAKRADPQSHGHHTRPVLERAKEFVGLDEQVEVTMLFIDNDTLYLKLTAFPFLRKTSAGLLRDLSSFLSTFQKDLSGRILPTRMLNLQ